LYFQAVKADTAVEAGIKLLPLLISSVISSVISGGLISATGYYNPAALVGMALMSIGAGLITTFDLTTPLSRWFGFQVVTGLGTGIGFQIGLLVVQNALSQELVPQGTACGKSFFAFLLSSFWVHPSCKDSYLGWNCILRVLSMFLRSYIPSSRQQLLTPGVPVQFSQSLGGALFIAVAQTVFQNGLIEGIQKNAPQLNPTIFINSGASNIPEVLAAMGQSSALEAVLTAYMSGLRNTYYISAAGAAVAFAISLGLEWKKIEKKDKNGPTNENIEKGANPTAGEIETDKPEK
jgi:hypothetical protein